MQASPNKMKYSLVVCLAFTLFTLGECLTDVEQAFIFELHQKCLPISKATNEMAQQAMTGNFPEDPEFKEHTLCMAKGMKFIDDNGNLNIPHIESELQKRVADAALREEIRSNCVVERETPQETAFQSSKCMFGYKDKFN